MREIDCRTPELDGVDFCIRIEPKGQARARATTIGGYARMYKPATDKSYERDIRTEAQAAMDNAPLLEGPLWIHVSAVSARPKSKTKKRGPNPRLWRDQKPDLDNVVKSVKDAIKGTVYKDDAQVCALTAAKIIAAPDEFPYLRVVVRTLQSAFAVDPVRAMGLALKSIRGAPGERFLLDAPLDDHVLPKLQAIAAGQKVSLLPGRATE